MNGEDWFGLVFVWFFATLFLMVVIMPAFVSHRNEKGMFMAILLWPLTALVLSPVLLVKLCTVVFKRRGLLSSWLEVITTTYKGAVK